jgi:iron complex transport system substrate-binding protein
LRFSFLNSFAGQIQGAKESTEIRRIVTTLPSATEIVSVLGLEDRLVGITHECDYPPSVKTKPVVMRSVFDTTKMKNREIDSSVLSKVTEGESIYEVDEALLKSLRPDLVITQELCEVCATPLKEVSKIIAKIEPKPMILSLAPHNLEDVLEDILIVGEATGTIDRAREVVSGLQKRIDLVKEKCSKAEDRPSVFCLEWMDPIYNSGHWMPELVSYAGGREVLGKYGEPSTVISWDQVLKANPEVIFATVCGYDVKRTLSEINVLSGRDGWDSLLAVRNGRVFVLDGGSHFSRSGPRLVDGLEIMARLLHPGLLSGYKPPDNSAYSLFAKEFV